jgi:hypothetical protein
VTLDIYAKDFEEAGHKDSVAAKLDEALGSILSG